MVALAVVAIRAAEPRLRAARVAADRVAAPPPLLEYVTFGHRRGVSAVLWLQLLTWYGGLAMQTKRVTLSKREDIAFLQRQSRIIIRMDPEFPDPYSFAALVLTWQAGEPHAALPFLTAAMSQFPNEWEYPFYYGFIHYRFLDDDKTAAQFFLRASRLPRSPVFVPLLAAKLLRHEAGTPDAIEAIEQLLRATLPEQVRDDLQNELVTLKAILTAEVARERYRKRTGRLANLDELVRNGYLSAMPVDALGVPLYIDPDGKVSARSGGRH